jgi:long-chain fatty acid transport protein
MFTLREQAVSPLGNAYAGTAVNIADASIGYYNPAGLAALKKSQLSIAGILESKRASFTDGTATSADTGGPVTGVNPTKDHANYLIPGVHMAAKINRYITLGLNCTSPFGFKTAFGENSIARYKDVNSKLTTYDLSPSIGIKLSEKYYVGFGIDWLYVNTNLQNYVSNTALQTVNAKGNKLGLHAGILWMPSKRMRMGLTYYSGFNVKLQGNLNLNNVAYNITSELRLPDRIVYSISADTSPEWSMMANVERVNWSKLKSLAIQQTNGTYSTMVWQLKDIWRFALGFDYKIRSWILKFGLAFEQGANSFNQATLRVPDGNNYQLACGFSYNFNANFSIDFGYAHLFYRGAKVVQSGFQTNTGVTTDTLNGGYKNSVDIVGIQLNLKIA